MKVNLFSLALLLLIALSPSLAHTAPGCDNAGNCYVRSAATGAASGTDWTNAYTDLPPTLQRGVTYYVAAGTYPPHTFNDPDSGPGTPWITIKAPTLAQHGTNTGWSNAYSGQALWECTSSTTCGAAGPNGMVGGIWNLQQENYILFDGSYSTPLPPYTDIAISGYGFKLQTNGFGGMGNRGNDCQLCGIILGGVGSSNFPLASPGTYSHDITIQYGEVEGNHQSSDSGVADAALQFEGGSYNLLFSHLYLHHTTWDFFLRGNHYGTVPGYGPGNNITIEYTHMDYDYTGKTPAGPHGAACSCSEGLQNFTWRYNVIANMVGTSAGPDTASGGGYLNGNGIGGPWYLYGNIWYADDPTHCAVGDGMVAIFDFDMSAGDLWFVNNSIVNEGYPFCPTAEATFGIGIGYRTAMHGFHEQNNLWYDSDISIYNGSDIVNDGLTSGGTQGGGVIFSTPVVHGYDAFFASPNTARNDTSSTKQVSASNPFVNLSGNDLRLIADTSPGAPLSSSGTYWNGTATVANTFNVDMNGTTRTSWTRGALQFAGAVLPVPIISLSPTALNFSAVMGTASAQQFVTVSNPGTAPLGIAAISLTGADSSSFNQSNTCGNAVSAASSCTITVTFLPSTAGTFTATLNISDSAAGSPHSVSLRGTATAQPDFTINASPASQALSATGSATYSIQLQSIGAFSQAVVLSVSGLPSGYVGKFSSTTVNLQNGGASANLSIQASTAAALPPHNREKYSPLLAWASVLLAIVPVLRRRKHQLQRALFGVIAILLFALAVSLTACGTHINSQSQASPQSYTLTITGTSGTLSHSTSVQLSVP